MKTRNAAKRAYILITALIAAMLMTACGSKTAYDRGYKTEAAYAVEAPAPAAGFNSSMSMMKEEAAYDMDYAEGSMDGAANGGNVNVNVETKLIRNIYLDIEVATSDVIQGASNDMSAMAQKYGGYVTNNSSSFDHNYAYANIQVKVPSAKADAFLADVKENGYSVTSVQDNVEDVTMEYTDVSSRLAVKEAAKEKYMSYLKDAETVEEILQIEDRLNDTIEEIESAKARLNVLNAQINYTTITINIRCRSVVEKQTFWDKAMRRLGYLAEDAGETLLGCIEWIVQAIIVIIFVAPVLFICLKLLNVILKAAGFKKKDGQGSLKSFSGKLFGKMGKKKVEAAQSDEKEVAEAAQGDEKQ